MSIPFVSLSRLAVVSVVITQTFSPQLVETARRGTVDEVRKLLDGGANVNAPAEPTHRETALMAASAEGNAEVVRLLLKHHADPDARDIFGGTSLQRAAWIGHLETVRALLDGGAKVDARFFSIAAERTALMVAAQRGHLEVVELLLKKKADVNAKAANGWTALRYATENHRDEIVKVLQAAGAK